MPDGQRVVVIVLSSEPEPARSPFILNGRSDHGAVAEGAKVVILPSTMTNPADDLLRISMRHGLPRCLHAVAELGIADALGESLRSAEELARDTGTHAGALARTL